MYTENFTITINIVETEIGNTEWNKEGNKQEENKIYNFKGVLFVGRNGNSKWVYIKKNR